MSKPLSSYTQSSSDWRTVLRKNNFRSRLVILCFVIIYIALGLFLDLYMQASFAPGMSHGVILKQLLTGKITPYATLICCAVALISLAVTYMFYNRLMLLGTQSTEVNAQSTDLQAKQLWNIVEEMRLAAGLNYTPKVYIIEASYMNAFASGYSEKSAMIAITSGLLAKLNREELTAVVAHELSHIRHGDIKLTLMAAVLSNLLLMIIDVLFYSVLFGGAGRRNNRSEGRGGNAGYLLIIVVILRYLLPLITLLLTLFLSRSREYMADAGCVELMRNNEPLASALMKISGDTEAQKENYKTAYKNTAHENIRRAAYIYDPAQAGIRAGGSMMDLFSTHPKLANRLAALGFKAQSKDDNA